MQVPPGLAEQGGVRMAAPVVLFDDVVVVDGPGGGGWCPGTSLLPVVASRVKPPVGGCGAVDVVTAETGLATAAVPLGARRLAGRGRRLRQ